MNLNELGVAVFRPDLKTSAGGGTVASHRHCRAAVDDTWSAAGDDDRVSREGSNFHRDEILSDSSAADAIVIEHRAEEVPKFELADFAFGVPAADLFIEGVQKLLASCRSGECRSLKKRAAKPPTIE